MKVNEFVSIEVDGRKLSDIADMVKAALLDHGDQRVSLSDLGGCIVFGVERDETADEHAARMRRETIAWRQKVAKEDAARIRARNTIGVEAYREWERNRLPDVE